MGTFSLTPGSIRFTTGSDRSGHQDAGYWKTVSRITANWAKSWLVAVLNRAVARQRRRDDSRTLRGLEERMLKDIGITRIDALKEADRLSRW